MLVILCANKFSHTSDGFHYLIEVKAKDLVDEENSMRLEFRRVEENSGEVRRVFERQKKVKRVQES